jgi:hypothetical protein
MAWIIMCDPQSYIINSLFIVDNLHLFEWNALVLVGVDWWIEFP